MMDKVLGSDETLRARANHIGGELVDLEADSEDAGSTAKAADASVRIGKAPCDDEDGERTSSEEEYENDFHEMLEEVIRHQADMQEDRDDDDELNDTDAYGSGLKGYAEEIKAELEETKAPNISQPDSVTMKRIATPAFASPKAAQIAASEERTPEGTTGAAIEPETPTIMSETSGRDIDTEELIW